MAPTHQELDQRSLLLHRLIAEKVRRDPGLLERAKSTLTNWRRSGPTRSDPYFEEWARLLGEGVEQCLAVAVEESERATALRQSSPLSCLLTPQERFGFLKQWRGMHATARS